MATSFMEHFRHMPDPRRGAGTRHALTDILVITVCAVICGAEDWCTVADFGRAKHKWFAGFLRLSHGIPSHDTFGRVFAALRPEAFEHCFASWMAALAECKQGELISMDGKTLRGSFDRASDKAAIHMVSAWASANSLCLGQIATEAKSNEITAMPKLLALLDLQDAVVSIDAEGCQKAIAGQIVEQGGDYILGLKTNQPTLHQEASSLLDAIIAGKCDEVSHAFAESVHGDHGRVETRRVWCTGELEWFEDLGQWPGLRSLVAVEAERDVNGQTRIERRYFISSLPADNAERLAALIRGHWSVENQLHWALDVSFNEDQCRIRSGNAAENLSRIRRTALALLKRDTRCKLGIKNKRLVAGWDHEYLLHLLTT